MTQKAHMLKWSNNSKNKIPISVVDFTDVSGTSATRNKIIEEARGNFVLVMDCHVMLCPVVDTLDRLFTFMESTNKQTTYFAGRVHDDLNNMSIPISTIGGQAKCGGNGVQRGIAFAKPPTFQVQDVGWKGRFLQFKHSRKD